MKNAYHAFIYVLHAIIIIVVILALINFNLLYYVNYQIVVAQISSILMIIQILLNASHVSVNYV